MISIQDLVSVMSLDQEIAYSLRIVVAAVCGAAIGVDRTTKLKQAGIKTHCFIACTAAVMMILSKYGFGDLMQGADSYLAGTKGADPSRIASQVISGIGFLGAGVLLKKGDTIHGLTTAAGFWVTTAIGLAIGSGMYYTGIFTTVLVLLVQIIFHRMHIGSDTSTYEVYAVVEDSVQLWRKLEKELKKNHLKVTVGKVEKMEGNLLSVQLLVKTTLPLTLDEAIGILETSESIKSISL